MTRRHVWFALQLAGTVVLFAVLFRGFDWAAVRTTLARISPALFAGSFLVVLSGHLLYAWRWWFVLGAMGVPITYPEALKQFLMGVFFGNLMPSAVGGDAAKVYYLGRRIGYVAVGASVFVDRFLGFLWLSVIGAALAWMAGAPTAMLVLNRNLLTVLASALIVLLAAVWLVPMPRLIPQRLRRGRAAPLVRRLEAFAGFVRQGGCRPGMLALSGAIVLVYVGLLTVVYRRYFAASGLPVPPLLPVMNAIVSTAVFVNVPISVNGIGLREQLHYLLFAALAVPKEVSVSLSLLLFAYTLALSLAGCVVWLRRRSRVPDTAA